MVSTDSTWLSTRDDLAQLLVYTKSDEPTFMWNWLDLWFMRNWLDLWFTPNFNKPHDSTFNLGDSSQLSTRVYLAWPLTLTEGWVKSIWAYGRVELARARYLNDSVRVKGRYDSTFWICGFFSFRPIRNSTTYEIKISFFFQWILNSIILVICNMYLEFSNFIFLISLSKQVILLQKISTSPNKWISLLNCLIQTQHQ